MKVFSGLFCSDGSCNCPTLYPGKIGGRKVCPMLPADQVEAMYLLGPDYQSTFAATESNTLLQQTPKAAALIIEGKEALGPKLLISYNAQVSVPSVCTADRLRSAASSCNQSIPQPQLHSGSKGAALIVLGYGMH